MSLAQDTIIALATPQGQGAIAVLRISGPEAISSTAKVFTGKNLLHQQSHTIHFGTIRDGEELIDEVLVALFVSPRSYTGEDVVEISCHGSPYIIQRLTRLFFGLGVRYAKPGEFTQRAFLHGKMDLAQAEAVADLIASENQAAHHAAMHQMRGGFSKKIRDLREKLIHFASMIELELDFGEEDVEFADRSALRILIEELRQLLKHLTESFALGNVIRQGIPVVIAGKPNAGKSTLLNALLNEEKAIVSDIPGTTRDLIEDQLVIEGIGFRFVDTAGLRDTEDRIEAIGVQRTYARMKEASLILYLFDVTTATVAQVQAEQEALRALGIPYLLIATKTDLTGGQIPPVFGDMGAIGMRQDQADALNTLKTKLLETATAATFSTGDTLVTNARHYQSLKTAEQAMEDVLRALSDGLTGDLLALDIRVALHALGEITGEITTDDLLANIFSKFCIGK